MPLSDRVVVSRRFRRAIRVDTDLRDPSAIEGFVCPESSATVLETMARHVSETDHAAFTWTGPYGSGKSSLAVALSAALSGDHQIRDMATVAIGERTVAAVKDALIPRAKGWRVLPVVGRRDRPAQVVGEAIEKARLVRDKRSTAWSDEAVFDVLQRIAHKTPTQTGGLLVLIDEMGKFLEGAAYDGTDIYFFQQLAELASRSNRRLVVVGILHQAFEEYAHRLSREMRDEWAKIQGRFADLTVNASPEEQLDLLSRAIKADQTPEKASGIASRVADLTRDQAASDVLEGCWPLHPVVACLLGPISRRRFGQNQRSIFGFLNSTEPRGFQDFLRNANEDELYTPELLWDYLRSNMEPSIMASPDGHRWAMAVDALDRCLAADGDDLHVGLLKTIAIVDLFKERSGLIPSLELLRIAMPDVCGAEIEKAVDELQEWSLVIYRKYSDSFSIFEGSDFDIEKAVDEAYSSIGELDFLRLSELAGIQPVIAKRHYHDTGTIRWCDMAIVSLSEVESAVAEYRPSYGSVGAFFLALPTPGDSQETVDRIVQSALDGSKDRDIVIGVPERSSWPITTLAKDLMALEHVKNDTPELRGDRVARNEVQARLSDIQGYIESELDRALNSALWHRIRAEQRRLDHAQLNSLASDIADARYPNAPRIHNELLNRVKPSSNANAARNALLRHMALYNGEERLQIEGYPPEGGLFDSLLGATNLYRRTESGWGFEVPDMEIGHPSRLAPAWTAATAYLKGNAHTSVSLTDVYDLWRQPPYGIRDGLLPVLAVAFIQSRTREVALYREGVFQSRLTDLDVQYLTNNPTDIQIRWMELSQASRDLLADMASIVRDMDPDNTLSHIEPIDAARGLVSIYDRLPTWVGRTQRLSANAKRVRQLFKQASDPNQFIFDDIPQLLSNDRETAQTSREVAEVVREGLDELHTAYPDMLHRLREILLNELDVPNTSRHNLAELRRRAQNVQQLSGDLRLEAFILRISQFNGTDADMESLASMAANKPSFQWTDADIDRSTIELADMARRFNWHEAFAHVKGRRDHRLAMAVVVGLDGEPLHDEFEVTDRQQARVEVLIDRVRATLGQSGEDQQNIILAALARVTAEYLESRNTTDAINTTEEAVS